MKPINAVTLSGFVLTAVVIYLLGYFSFIPAWPIFITWACFSIWKAVSIKISHSLQLFYILD